MSKVFLQHVQDLCRGCAAAVYNNTAPNKRYASDVSNLLFMTIAHESDGFRARRQYGFSWGSDRGAWSLAQVEQGSVLDSMKFMAARTNLAQRAVQWASCDDRATADWLLDLPVETVLRLLPMSERLTVLFCRLHYLRVPAFVPHDLSAQAEYAKRYYNTMAGKARPSDYHRAFVAAIAEL
jgi:hypothetical protein